jgi:NTE family protein
VTIGGGAAKGLAHVGVLRGLEEDGIEVAAVAGTSMGSIIGALHATGMSGHEMAAFFSAVDWSRLARIMVRSVDGSAFHSLLRQTLGSTTVEETDLPFAAVCCDLDTGEEVILRSGSLADAVRASSAIPGVLAPLTVGGRTLVDGAMVTPVPAIAAGALTDAPVLAVNVLGLPAPGEEATPVVERFFGGTAPAVALQRVEDFLDRHRYRFRRRDRDLPNRLGVVARSFHIMQNHLANLCERQVPTVEPEVGAIGWFEFERAEEIIEQGYRAYRKQAPWFSTEVRDSKRRNPS